MTKIKQPKTNYSKLGSKLRSARLKKDISRASLARQLQLKTADIIDIEAGLPASWEGIYKRGYILAYAKIVNVDLVFKEELKNNDIFKTSSKPLNQRSLVVSQLLATAAIASVILGILGYVALQVFVLVTPPALVVYEPADGKMTTKSVLDISGKTAENTDVSINGVSILTEPDGSFKTQIPLKQGINDLTITATNRLTKQNSITRTVIADYQIDPIRF
jgi:cytoskeletal protein RodZ